MHYAKFPHIIFPRSDLLQYPVITVTNDNHEGPALILDPDERTVGVFAYYGSVYVEMSPMFFPSISIESEKHNDLHILASEKQSASIDYPPGEVTVNYNETHVDFTVRYSADADESAVESWYKDYYKKELFKLTRDFWSCSLDTDDVDCEEGSCTTRMSCVSHYPYDAKKLAKTLSHAFDVTP